MAFRHGKATAVLVDQYNLSAYFNSANTTRSVDTPETTTFGANAKTYLAGLADAKVSLAGLFDGAIGAIDQILFADLAAGLDDVVTVGPDGGALQGRRCTLLAGVNTTYEIDAPVSDVVKIKSDMVSDGGADQGVFVDDLKTISVTGNSASGTDNGALTSNGGVGHLHVTANTVAASSTIKIQHSIDNSTYADLIVFTAVTSTQITAQRAVVAPGTTVNRWLRGQWTPGGAGNITLALAFARR